MTISNATALDVERVEHHLLQIQSVAGLVMTPLRTPFDLVVLDLDGVLANTEGVWLRAKQLAARELGLCLDAHFVESRQGYGLRRFADDLQAVNGFPTSVTVTDRFERIADSFAMDHYQNRLRVKPGAIDFIMSCRTAGLLLGLCSNCPMRF